MSGKSYEEVQSKVFRNKWMFSLTIVKKMFRKIKECFIVDISSLNLRFIGVCFHGGEFPRLLLTITSKGH